MAAETARGFAVFAGIAPEIIRASAREAEARGFASFWVNHPGPVDGLGALAQAGAETQRIDLGVGVIPLHTRGPEDIVAGVRQHRLAPTRLLLGIGSPNPQALRRVRDLNTDPAGNVVGLHADFEYRCDGSRPALRGTIRHFK